MEHKQAPGAIERTGGFTTLLLVVSLKFYRPYSIAGGIRPESKCCCCQCDSEEGCDTASDRFASIDLIKLLIEEGFLESFTIQQWVTRDR